MPTGKVSYNNLSTSLQKKINSNQGLGFVHNFKVITTPISKIYIDLPFDKDLDMIFIFRNNYFLVDGKDYNISEDSTYIEKTDLSNWDGTEDSPSTFTFLVFKAIPLKEEKIDGTLLAPGSIDISSMNKEFVDNIQKLFTDYYTKDDVNKLLNEKKSYIVSATDPATDASNNIKTNDLWIDTVNNMFKLRLANGTWKPVGAIYYE